MKPFKSISKNGLLWLVFCVLIFAVIFLENDNVSKPINYNLYPNGFLEKLDDRGHGIEKHVGKTDSYLHERLRRENISAASTFNNMAEAETEIRNVLINRGDLVQAWIETEKSNRKSFYLNVNYPVGRVLKKSWNKPRDGNQVRVVLLRDNRYSQNFRLLTAYPSLK